MHWLVWTDCRRQFAEVKKGQVRLSLFILENSSVQHCSGAVTSSITAASSGPGCKLVPYLPRSGCLSGPELGRFPECLRTAPYECSVSPVPSLHLSAERFPGSRSSVALSAFLARLGRRLSSTRQGHSLSDHNRSLRSPAGSHFRGIWGSFGRRSPAFPWVRGVASTVSGVRLVCSMCFGIGWTPDPMESSRRDFVRRCEARSCFMTSI